MTPDDAAPAIEQDQPTALDSLLAGVPRSLSPELLQFARRADLRLEDEEDTETDGPDAIEAPETESQDQPVESAEESVDRFTDFDLSTVPEEAREAVEAAEKRMQADYTRKTQTLAETRREAERAQQIVEALNDPTTAPFALKQLGYDDRKLLEMYGYDLDGEDSDDEFDADFEDEFRDPRVDQLIAERQQEQVTDFIAGEIADLENELDQEFDAEEHRFLDAHARANPNVKGEPDVQGAYEFLKSLYKHHEGRITKGKINSDRPPAGGKPATRQVDLSKMTPDERAEYRREQMLNAAERSDASATA